MTDAILVLNAGSSSIKFSLFVERGRRARARRCAARSKGSTPRRASSREDAARQDHRRADVGRGRAARPRRRARPPRWRSCASTASDTRSSPSATASCTAGSTTRSRCASTPQVLATLEKLVPLAPLHQPHNLAPIRVARSSARRSCRRSPASTPRSTARSPTSRRRSRCRRDHRAAACGATASTGCPTSTSRSVLPDVDATAAARARRSCCTSATAPACARSPAGKSVASTMGFTAVDGLPMGTRCGALDPGVMLYLMDERGMDARAIEKLIYQQSGLLGVSGISSDMRTLLASDEPRAHARDRPLRLPHRPRAGLACRGAGRARRARVHRRHRRARRGDPRARVPRRGVARRRARRRPRTPSGGPRISTAASRVPAWVIPTNEELMIARHTRRLIAAPARNMEVKSPLKGKSAVVTGSTSGIGLGIARALAARGREPHAERLRRRGARSRSCARSSAAEFKVKVALQRRRHVEARRDRGMVAQATRELGRRRHPRQQRGHPARRAGRGVPGRRSGTR